MQKNLRKFFTSDNTLKKEYWKYFYPINSLKPVQAQFNAVCDKLSADNMESQFDGIQHVVELMYYLIEDSDSIFRSIEN